MPFPFLAAAGLAQGLLGAFGKRKSRKNAQKAAAIQREDALNQDRYRYENITRPELLRRAAENARAGKLSAAFLRGSGLTGLWGEDEVKRRETPATVAEWDDRMSGAFGRGTPEGDGGFGFAGDLLGAAMPFIPAATPKAGVDYRAASAGGGAGGNNLGFSASSPFGQAGQGTNFKLDDDPYS